MYFSLAHQAELPYLIQEKTELGLWSDSNINRLSSFYIAHSYGIRVKIQGLYVESLWGISTISNPDNVLLSGNIQFMQDLSIGLMDGLGRGVGITYKHFSNAGIKRPNFGRDAILIQVIYPIGLE